MALLGAEEAARSAACVLGSPAVPVCGEEALGDTDGDEGDLQAVTGRGRLAFKSIPIGEPRVDKKSSYPPDDAFQP